MQGTPNVRSIRATVVIALVILMALVLAPSAIAADTWTVDAAEPDNTQCVSPTFLCKDIQAAINAAAPGDTINVLAGTYGEQITISKSLTVTGEDGAVLDGTGLAPTWTTGVKIRSGNVTFNNIDVANFTQDGITAYDNIDMPNLHITNSKISNIQPGYWGFGIYVGYESEGFGYTPPDLTSHLDFSGLLIEGNEITNVHSSALVLQSITGTPDTLVVRNNNIHDNTTNSGIWIDCARNLLIQSNTVATNKWGIEFSCYAETANTLNGPYSPKDITLSGNLISSSTLEGIALYEAWPSFIAVTGNSIQGSATGIDNPLADTLNASGNWLGSNAPAIVAGVISDNVDYTPWLDSGTDTAPGTAGFQGDFATLWVDDDSPQTGTTGRIQEGIDLVSGSTVNVAAGTYVEDPVINKAVTLLGPNAGINPNTGTRVAEAVIHPAVSAPDPSVCEVMVYVGVSNVTIKGFTFDGDNPGLTSGITIDGADVDACEIIASSEGVGNIVVENNILKHSTYSGIDFYNYVIPAATAGNYIRYNRLEDIGETTYNWGIGVLVYNNFYADITDNVMTGVRTGVQTGNYYNANPGTTGSISNNEIGVWRLGIFHNLAYGSASPFTISGNTITAETYPGANKWNGLLLSSIQDAVNATITDNDIVIPGAVSFAPPGYTAGYNVWNVTTSAPIAISGGTVTGGDYGVFVNNYEGYSSNANNTAVNLDGMTVVDSAIAGVYVKDSPSNTNSATVYANIQNCTIDTNVTGILVEGSDATAKANGNNLAGNPTFGVNNAGSALMDAKNNWWGTACSPASLISGNVDYTPWWGDPTGSFSLSANATTINPGGSAAQQMAVINCAAPGTTITYPTSAYPGGIIVTANGVTIGLNGSTVGPGSPAYTIVGDDVTITGPGVLDGNGNASPGILVDAGADNFILDGVEVREWADGVQVAGLVDGDIESLKIVNNWIHSNTDAGLQVDKWVAGVVTIQGNLFKVNDGNGVDYGGAGTLNAEYNSWGADGGPAVTGGDGAGATVDFNPWTFAEVYIDVDPGTPLDQVVRSVDESTSFDVDLNVDGENLYGLAFKFTYDPNYLTFNGPPAFQAPWAGNCYEVGTPQPGTFAYTCFLISAPAENGGTVATFNFTATDNGGYTPPPGPWSTYFDISADPTDTNAGAVGGVKVFVNNAGYNDASVMPDRDITNNAPPYDGKIIITGIAQFTGFVDLQGRPNDSGALVEAKEGSDVKANATSASSGKYTTSYVGAFLLAIGGSYDVTVDRALYLPATRTWTLTTRPLTTLTTVILLGGDATDNNFVDLDDAVCIGGDYGTNTSTCSSGSSDVNGDGTINILDLVLMGGNYFVSASPWTP